MFVMLSISSSLRVWIIRMSAPLDFVVVIVERKQRGTVEEYLRTGLAVE